MLQFFHLYSTACWEKRLYLVAIFYPQKQCASYSYYLTVFVLPTRTISHLLCHETATLFSAAWLIECGCNLLALSMVTKIRNWTQALWSFPAQQCVFTALSWMWLGALLVSFSVLGVWSGCSARCNNAGYNYRSGKMRHRIYKIIMLGKWYGNWKNYR